MDESQQILKKRFYELPESLGAFIKSENWRQAAQEIGRKFGFDEEKYAAFENEIFLVLLCFEPKRDFTSNLQNELGLDQNTADLMASEVRVGIFSKVTTELDGVDKQMTENESKEAPTNTVGQSFEQIILNQARAMQPARPVDGRVMNHESRIMGGAKGAPDNLPTNEPQQQRESVGVPDYSTSEHKVHDYKPGADPYREPTE